MNPSFRYTRLSKDNAACLLIDHQSGLISLVQDWRNDIEGLGALFSNYVPNYRNLITSYLAKK